MIKTEAKFLAVAVKVAAINHDGQYDRAGKPYILHPLWVMDKVMQYGFMTAAVGVLHDVVEDTSVTVSFIKELFGDEIGDAIDAISKREGEEYTDYMQRVASNRHATLVKMADLQHNSDLSRMKGTTKKDLDRVTKYNCAFAYLMKVKAENGW